MGTISCPEYLGSTVFFAFKHSEVLVAFFAPGYFGVLFAR